VLDVVCAFFLLVIVTAMGTSYGMRAWLLGRARQRRSDGVEATMLGRPTMEAAYWFFGPVVRLMMLLRVTPNGVTAFSLLPAAGSAVALATGHLGVGALLATMAGYADLLDGQLARRLGTSSDAGEVFDAAVDRYGEFFLMAGLVIHYRSSLLLVLLALGALQGSIIVSYATAKAEAMGLVPPKGIMRRAERAVYIITGAAFVPMVAWVMPPWWSARPELYNLPLMLPLFLVAVLANVSGSRRMYKTTQMVRERSERKAREQASVEALARQAG
jgi:CDP-diacylglycerol--glycerol-3-phosphate 3-phosphatidyltransferase